MKLENFSGMFLEKLEHAALQWAGVGEAQSLVDIIDQVQKESYREGYIHAIDVLQDNLGGEER